MHGPHRVCVPAGRPVLDNARVVSQFVEQCGCHSPEAVRGHFVLLVTNAMGGQDAVF